MLTPAYTAKHRHQHLLVTITEKYYTVAV